MSNSIYFDFHTPELFEVWKTESWSKWYSKLVQLELSGKESFFSERISDESNLLVPNNTIVWELFKEENDGKIVDRHLIADILSIWKKLYQESQTSQSSLFQDMFTPGQIKILLKKYKGNHLVFTTK